MWLYIHCKKETKAISNLQREILTQGCLKWCWMSLKLKKKCLWIWTQEIKRCLVFVCYLNWNFADYNGIFSFSGNYFYVEGNDGVRDDFAVLTTPNVTTGVGQSLGFYYHIVTENQFTIIRSDGLSVIAQLPDGGSQLLWWQNQTSSNEWSYGCVNLPDNTHLNIQFVTRRIGLDNQNNVFDADVAVDDIALLLLPCTGGKIFFIFFIFLLICPSFCFSILLPLKFF